MPDRPCRITVIPRQIQSVCTSLGLYLIRRPRSLDFYSRIGRAFRYTPTCVNGNNVKRQCPRLTKHLNYRGVAYDLSLGISRDTVAGNVQHIKRIPRQTDSRRGLNGCSEVLDIRRKAGFAYHFDVLGERVISCEPYFVRVPNTDVVQLLFFNSVDIDVHVLKGDTLTNVDPCFRTGFLVVQFHRLSPLIHIYGMLDDNEDTRIERSAVFQQHGFICNYLPNRRLARQPPLRLDWPRNRRIKRRDRLAQVPIQSRNIILKGYVTRPVRIELHPNDDSLKHFF